MTASEVIEAYVTDVAVLLPRRQRNDVAFELRALLNEELQAKAGDEGRPADDTLAIELVRAFGRPADVAARYRPALTVIDPADGPRFVRWAGVGLAIIWALGLLSALGEPIHSTGDLLRALGRWWGGTVIPSMWWPGVLVVSFGLASWTARRWPQTSAWRPRAGDRIRGGRAALVLGIIGILCGLFVLLDPRRVLDVFWGGRAAQAAYDALTYTGEFRERQGPFLLALLLLNFPLFITVLVNGRWSAAMRRIQFGLSLALCAAMVWTVLGGPVFLAPQSDRAAKASLILVTALTIAGLGVQIFRSVRPAPNRA